MFSTFCSSSSESSSSDCFDHTFLVGLEEGMERNEEKDRQTDLGLLCVYFLSAGIVTVIVRDNNNNNNAHFNNTLISV